MTKTELKQHIVRLEAEADCYLELYLKLLNSYWVANMTPLQRITALKEKDELYTLRPNLFKFLVDRGVSRGIAEDAQHIVSEFALAINGAVHE